MGEDVEPEAYTAELIERVVDDVRTSARDLLRDDGQRPAEDAIVSVLEAVTAILAELVADPGRFATPPEAEAFAEMMTETSDGPYFIGTSFADTIVANGLEVFDQAHERREYLLAIREYIGGALDDLDAGERAALRCAPWAETTAISAARRGGTS